MRKQSEDQSETLTEAASPSEKGERSAAHVGSNGADEKLNLPTPPRKEGQPGPGGVVRRDWAAALDLINEACEAVKMSEQRAKDAEAYNLSLVQSHGEQIKRIETRVQAAESRAEAAERRAAEAEEWLLLFHDTIVAGVKGVLDR